MPVTARSTDASAGSPSALRIAARMSAGLATVANADMRSFGREVHGDTLDALDGGDGFLDAHRKLGNTPSILPMVGPMKPHPVHATKPM